MVFLCKQILIGHFVTTWQCSICHHPIDNQVRSIYSIEVGSCAMKRSSQSACTISDQGPVVQSMVSLMNVLMTNSLTAVAKVFSNTLIFLLQKLLTFFSAKNINVFAIFQDRNFNVMLANTLIKFWTTGPWAFAVHISTAPDKRGYPYNIFPNICFHRKISVLFGCKKCLIRSHASGLYGNQNNQRVCM